MLYTSMTNSFIITESAVTSPIYAWPPPLHASHVRYHRKSQLISWHTISFMGQTAYRLTHAHNPSYILKTPCAHTHTAHCQPHKHNPVCMYPQTSWSNSQGAQSSTLIQHRAHLIRPDIPKVLSQDSPPTTLPADRATTLPADQRFDPAGRPVPTRPKSAAPLLLCYFIIYRHYI